MKDTWAYILRKSALTEALDDSCDVFMDVGPSLSHLKSSVPWLQSVLEYTSQDFDDAALFSSSSFVEKPKGLVLTIAESIYTEDDCRSFNDDLLEYTQPFTPEELRERFSITEDEAVEVGARFGEVQDRIQDTNALAPINWYGSAMEVHTKEFRDWAAELSQRAGITGGTSLDRPVVSVLDYERSLTVDATSTESIGSLRHRNKRSRLDLTHLLSGRVLEGSIPSVTVRVSPDQVVNVFTVCLSEYLASLQNPVKVGMVLCDREARNRIRRILKGKDEQSTFRFNGAIPGLQPTLGYEVGEVGAGTYAVFGLRLEAPFGSLDPDDFGPSVIVTLDPTLQEGTILDPLSQHMRITQQAQLAAPDDLLDGNRFDDSFYDPQD